MAARPETAHEFGRLLLVGLGQGFHCLCEDQLKP
jgi:hypothetical protein